MRHRPGAIATTAAFTVAGYILYLPANVLPVMTITRFGGTESYTILGGVRDLAEAGLWPLALLVPLDRLVGKMQNMVAHANDLIASPEVKRSLQKLYRTLDNIERPARNAQVQIGPSFYQRQIGRRSAQDDDCHLGE